MEIVKNYICVTNQETLKELLKHIKQYDTFAVDTETDSLNPRKGGIVGWSICGTPGTSFYIPTQIWNPKSQNLEDCNIGGKSVHEITKKVLTLLHGKKLIAHNASFDLRFIKNFYGVDLISDLWVETSLLVHTLQEEGAFGYGNPFALKSIAIMEQKNLGLDVEKEANEEQIKLKESIKENGGETKKDNFEIYKANLNILAEYGAADTDLTLRICNLYLERLKEEGLWDFFFVDEVMPVYKEVTIPMEEQGVTLDLSLLEKTKKEISQDLKNNAQTVLQNLIDTPQGKQWIIDTSLKVFPPSNNGTWVQAFCKKFDIPLPKSKKTQRYLVNPKNVEKLPQSNEKDFLLTGDLKYLDSKEILKISMSLWRESNGGEYINIQSRKQLGEIVFNYMKIKPKSKTAKGKPQFDEEMIEQLPTNLTWSKNLRIYNKLLKIKSTYIDRFLENHEDGRYYFYFKQNGTVSGRYGSDAQQLSKPMEPGQDEEIVVRYNNLVRKFFIASAGKKFIDCDYESLEPRIFSFVTGDEGLKDIYRNNWDFYSTVAIKTENLDKDLVKYPNGVSADKNSNVFLKKIDPVKRNKAKAYALGLAYGMSPYALAMTLEVPQKEGEKLHRGYLKGFPKLEQWIEDSRVFTKEHGFIQNYVGRRRHLPHVKKLYKTFGDNLMDWRFRKSLENQYGRDKVMKVYRDYNNGLNNCLNFQIQSLAASIVNRSALQINRKTKELNNNALVVLQIHDQLIIECEKNQCERIKTYTQEIMENIIILDGVRLIAEPQIADNLFDGH